MQGAHCRHWTSMWTLTHSARTQIHHHQSTRHHFLMFHSLALCPTPILKTGVFLRPLCGRKNAAAKLTPNWASVLRPRFCVHKAVSFFAPPPGRWCRKMLTRSVVRGHCLRLTIGPRLSKLLGPPSAGWLGGLGWAWFGWIG